jgi:hypothetical protein
MRLPLRIVLAAAVFSSGSAALFLSVQNARAEAAALAGTPEALRRAIQLSPANADLYARLATMDGADERDLTIALASNPWRTSWWTAQAVREEQDGDVAAAERSLLKANAVCQYYTPRWSLAAFYYRQGNREGFTRWARLALSSDVGSSEPIFQMAQRLGIDPGNALRTIVPRLPHRLEDFRRFLVNHGQASLSFDVASVLVSAGSPKDLDGVLQSADQLFLAGDSARAVALWNQIVSAGWLKMGRLDPGAGISQASDGIGEPFGAAFLWRFWNPGDVSLSSEEGEGALRLDFGGLQPEQCRLLSRNIPLLPARKYRLTVRSRAKNILPGSGLRWAIQAASGVEVIGVADLTPANDQTSELEMLFETPGKPIPMQLVFSYDKPRGRVRIDGSLTIASVRVNLLP